MATHNYSNSSTKTQLLILTLSMSLTVSNSKNGLTYLPTSPRYSSTSPRYSPTWHEEQESKAREVYRWKQPLLRRLELQFPEIGIGFDCNSSNCMGNCNTCVWKQLREAKSYHFHKEGGIKAYAVAIVRDTKDYMELDAVIVQAEAQYEAVALLESSRGPVPGFSDMVTEFVDECYIEDGVAMNDLDGFVPTVSPVGKHSFLDEFEYLSRTIAPNYLEEHVRHLCQEAREAANTATERANHLDQVYTAVQAQRKRARNSTEDSTEDSVQIIRKKARKN